MTLIPVHVVEFSPDWEGGIGGFDWSKDRYKVLELTMKFMIEDHGYAVRRWNNVMVDEDLSNEQITEQLDAMVDARELGKPVFEGTSVLPREALEDLVKLATLGIQFKDDTLWCQYMRVIDREDDEVYREVNDRRIKAAENMDRIKVKYGA